MHLILHRSLPGGYRHVSFSQHADGVQYMHTCQASTTNLLARHVFWLMIYLKHIKQTMLVHSKTQEHML